MPSKFRILLSFHYFGKVDLDELVSPFPHPPEIFADSGAFSAYTQQSTIDVEEYAAWIKRWGHLFTTYVSLDAIGDAEQTLINHRRMQDLGLDPVPTFHCGEPWEYLERYCAEHRYVALGGMVGQNKPALARWLIPCFERGATTGTVFHGFGQTTTRIVKDFPFYSIDSSTWVTGYRYGLVKAWDPVKARFIGAATGNPAEIFPLAKLIRAQGGDPHEMARPEFTKLEGRPEEGRAEQTRLTATNLVGWLRFEKWMQRRHGVVPGPSLAHADGPVVFFAASGSDPDRLARADVIIEQMGTIT